MNNEDLVHKVTDVIKLKNLKQSRVLNLLDEQNTAKLRKFSALSCKLQNLLNWPRRIWVKIMQQKTHGGPYKQLFNSLQVHSACQHL